MNDDIRPDPYSIHLRARPLRVAFVVDGADCPADMLDDIFAMSHRAWGGRLWPIVPAERGELAPMYRRLLANSDPDVVYTYCDLTGVQVAWIDRHVHPWWLGHNNLRPSLGGERPDYQPALGAEPVDATEAIIPAVGSRWYPHFTPTVLTANTSAAWHHRRWFSRNFGLVHPSSVSESISAWPCTVVENDWDDTRVLRELAAVRYPITAASSAATRSKFFRPRTSPRGPSYCLVVGDTPSDWLMFWNLIFTIAPYQWERWHTLCVSPTRFEDAEFVEALHTFLREHAVRSGENPPDLVLRSTSVDDETLRSISESLGARHLDPIRRVERVEPWSIRRVEEDERDSFPILERPWNRESPETTEQQAISSRVLLQRPPSDVALSGQWVLDLDVEFHEWPKFFSNQQLWWTLPRRVPLPQLFMRKPGRVNGSGSLSYSMGQPGTVELSIPSREAVLRVALANGRHGYLRPDDLRQPGDSPYAEFRLSDEGKYVKGVVELFAGLQGASNFFGNSFWRSLVEHICHRSARSDVATLEPIANKLRKQQQRLISDLKREDFGPLSEHVLSIARAEPVRDADLTWDKLEQRFVGQRRTYLESHPDYLRGVQPADLEIQASGMTREDERVVQELRRALQEYVEAGVFLQGIRYRCPRCGLGFWQSISEASRSIECAGCRAPIPLKVESEWTYRLNTLVRNTVAYHGAIPVIWTLATLRRRARTMFLYWPGLSAFRTWDAPIADAELDLVAIRDGKLVIGEVKTVPNEFHEDDLRRLGDLAVRLSADVVVVAAFRTTDQRMRSIGQRLEEYFPGREFSVEALTPSPEVNDPTPDAFWSHWETA